MAILITPSSATINVGDSLTFTATLPVVWGTTNRGVAWTAANTAVATVDARGVVAAIGGGTTTIVATSVADPRVKGAATITVGSILLGPYISSISQNGKAADLSNISGTIAVVVTIPAGPPSYAKVDLVLSCGGTDTIVATQSVTSTTSTEQSVTLSVNTATYKNGPCVLKARATTSSGAIVASSSTPITLNNPAPASATY